MSDLSIVVPAFNAETYLAETLGSCLNVQPAPAEILVVDDGSTDGTAAVCAGFGIASAIAGCGTGASQKRATPGRLYFGPLDSLSRRR